MANKRNREIWAKEEKQRKYAAETNGLGIYPILSIIASTIVLLTYFFAWGYVYNTGINGAEVEFNGFNALFAALAGDYSSTAYGDIAMPFYYDAKKYVEIIGALSVVAFFVLAANVIAAIIALVKKIYALNFVSLGLCVAQVAFYVVIFAVALDMKNGTILSRYCSGNPECSIRSAAIIAAIAALLSAVPAALACVKYLNARKILK